MVNRPKIVVAMFGARRGYAVPKILYQSGYLEHFFTDSYIGNKPWLEYLLRSVPDSIRPRFVRRWLGRQDSILPPECVTSFDWLGIRSVLVLQRARGSVERERLHADINARFADHILSYGFGSADAVWGFNTASLELFEAAKDQGIQCILEQTILPKKLERKLLREISMAWPGWQLGQDIGLGEGLMEKREAGEWELADQILAGSKFVADGLIECGVPKSKIRVIPYGVSSTNFRPNFNSKPEGPLRVLFAGEVGLRKGTPYLLEALRRIGPDKVQARFAGGVALNRNRIAPYSEVACFLGHVPRSEMPELFQWAQVFILPSIVEGSAAATYEALMTGLPVIATRNAGTIIQDDVDGFIVPVANVEALVDTISSYADDPDLYARHAAGAVLARERAGLQRYGDELSSFLSDVLPTNES